MTLSCPVRRRRPHLPWTCEPGADVPAVSKVRGATLEGGILAHPCRRRGLWRARDRCARDSYHPCEPLSRSVPRLALVDRSTLAHAWRKREGLHRRVASRWSGAAKRGGVLADPPRLGSRVDGRYGRATPPRRLVVSTTPAMPTVSSAAMAAPSPNDDQSTPSLADDAVGSVTVPGRLVSAESPVRPTDGC